MSTSEISTSIYISKFVCENIMPEKYKALWNKNISDRVYIGGKS